MNATVSAIIPSWEGAKGAEPSSSVPFPLFVISILGATESVDGGTYLKKNTVPTHDGDFDIRCDSQGALSGDVPLSNVSKVYIWGYGFTLNGEHFECQAEYDNATEIEITKDTEIVLWGANSK